MCSGSACKGNSARNEPGNLIDQKKDTAGAAFIRFLDGNDAGNDRKYRDAVRRCKVRMQWLTKFG